MSLPPPFRTLVKTISIHMKLSMVRPMFQFIILFQPFIFATLGILIYGHSDAEQIFHYVVLGSGFMTLWSSIVFSSASDVNRERMYGTLEIIFTSPTSFANTLIGKIIGNTIWGILSMFISFVYLTVLYDVQIQINYIWLFFGSFLLNIISLSIFAFFLAMSFTLSRQATMLMNCIEYPIYLICGFMFPISILPAWIQPISWLLPPTWTIELFRDVTGNQLIVNDIMQTIIILIVLSFIYLALAVIFYRLVDKKARIAGTLGVY
ncbi:ABC transporter permease [Cytobacillus sp. IB215665]|uniref:ABC transporter permease n=1 Tax=Cytobacillus sp. IB215665 TaxID=3097357 RepID=UPI002A0B244B|nr:ABC transporter permease [Cytobacillus sp. IB215665]MDX8366746.1 ABC transporter permease [Cytobacillus sp. IB215665]